MCVDFPISAKLYGTRIFRSEPPSSTLARNQREAAEVEQVLPNSIRPAIWLCKHSSERLLVTWKSVHATHGLSC